MGKKESNPPLEGMRPDPPPAPPYQTAIATKRMDLKFQITKADIPAFSGFLQGSAIRGEIAIGINLESTVMACAEHDISFYELMAEHTVHEMLHAFQEL